MALQGRPPEVGASPLACYVQAVLVIEVIEAFYSFHVGVIGMEWLLRVTLQESGCLPFVVLRAQMLCTVI